MTQEEDIMAMEFISELAGYNKLDVGEVMSELSYYKLSLGFFEKQYVCQLLNPVSLGYGGQPFVRQLSY